MEEIVLSRVLACRAGRRRFFWLHRFAALLDGRRGCRAGANRAKHAGQSGDWVIAHLDGVPYVEKSPLDLLVDGGSFRVFGVHDWAARIPVALAAVLLAWVVYRYGRWAFEERAGFYAGLVIATCVGLFLFTRIQIPDVMLTLTTCLAYWAFQRATALEEAHPRRWAAVLAASLGVGVMLKGLIALVVPVGGILAYLVLTRQLLSREVWKRLHLLSGVGIFLVIAAPWHVLATVANAALPQFHDA